MPLEKEQGSRRGQGHKRCPQAGAASDQLYAILMDTPPPDHDGPGGDDGVGEITGIDPPNTLEIRTMPVAGGASTWIVRSAAADDPLPR